MEVEANMPNGNGKRSRYPTGRPTISRAIRLPAATWEAIDHLSKLTGLPTGSIVNSALARSLNVVAMALAEAAASQDELDAQEEKR